MYPNQNPTVPSYSPPPAVDAVSEIDAEANRLRNALSLLENATESLIRRLSPVSRVPPPAAIASSPPQAVSSCPFSQGLQGFRGQVDEVSRRLNEAQDLLAL